MGKCMPGEAYSFSACVCQTNEKSTHSIERACKINITLKRGNLVSLSHTTPLLLNHNYWINLWVWILELNVFCPKTPLSILAVIAPSPIPLALKLLLVPHLEIVHFVFCAEKDVYMITLLLRPIMKSKIPPKISLPPIQLLQKPMFLLWYHPFLI